PGSRPGSGRAVEPGLRARLYRCEHAKGSTPGAAGGRRDGGGDPARRRGGQSLPIVCRQRRRRPRFFGDNALPAPRIPVMINENLTKLLLTYAPHLGQTRLL